MKGFLRPRLAISVALMACFLGGCLKKKASVPDAGAEVLAPTPIEAADASPAVAAAPPVANRNEVARFGDEKDLGRQTQKIVSTVLVRKSPPSGPHFLTIKAGSEVVRIAEHEGFFLVEFVDPKNAQQNLMGWVSEAAFKIPPPANTGSCKVDKDCKAPQVCMSVNKALRCAQKCTDDKECPAGQLCDGEGVKDNVVVEFCIAAKTDAGAPSSDAGAGASDAGAKGDAAVKAPPKINGPAR